MNDWTESELRVLQAMATGTPVDLRSVRSVRLRAERLVDMLTGTGRAADMEPRALKVRGARITGAFDLEARALLCPVLLRDCHFDEPVILSEATAPAIRLPGCHLAALTAEQLRTTGSLELNDGFSAAGGIRLSGAGVGGSLNLSGARLIGTGGRPALHADGIAVEQSLLCRDGFSAEGEVRLVGARVGGVISFDGASLRNAGGRVGAVRSPAQRRGRPALPPGLHSRGGVTAVRCPDRR
ncbi:hypothetical protein [Streptomyces sp. NPDC127197]|uniref:hypothetical protein n=1 Tax=Streptomyces sp. NPDC127197 TaxID=3345388 RepID=UPI00362803DB